MNWFHYVNYRICQFYKGKNKFDPEGYSFFATVMLLNINIVSIIFLVNFYYPILKVINKYYFAILYVALCIFHYLDLYKGRRYTIIFEDLSKYDSVTKRNIFRIYFIMTITTLLVLLLIIEFKRKGIF